MSLSNNITAILNFISLLCSVPIIGAGIWLASKPDNQCLHLARWPLVILGFLILLVSLAGFVGAFWNRQCLLAIYLFAMATLIVILIIFLVFAFVVTRSDGSVEVPGRAYKEYYLSGFSGWLRHYVGDGSNWGRIRVCLSESGVCEKLSRGQPYITADQYFQTHLSPLQASCCKPPTVCGFVYENPTVWVNPSNVASDPDCIAWSNDQSLLCYNCQSCKAGMLGNLRQEWRKANIALIIAAVVLIWVYVIGCSAFKNAQTEDLFRRYKQGYT
ncbi:Tetraspanin family protein [Rhynchospora pubera]|uniref:Tetraspanin family protein n=1 Tax=Rhynchospora pubera TaxID=906938 RepID=A0AAV8DT62_9POAL|nr:Tetraspanin family protein [Rhynchospora pubera]